MKIRSIATAGLLIVLASTLITPPAKAGQINATGATISWDDSAFYIPVSCSAFKFNVEIDSTIWQVSLSINNKFGDIVASSSTTYGNGQVSLQVCANKDLTGTVLIARVTTHKVVDSIYEKPITFLSRTATPSASAKPTPAPTVTVTATPSPAPTVYLNNPADATLTELVISLKSQLALVNSKLKKICATKPKPKGC